MCVNNARLAEAYAVELELSADVAQLYYGIQTNYQLVTLLEQLQQVTAFLVQTHQARSERGLESRTLVEEAKAQLAPLRNYRVQMTRQERVGDDLQPEENVVLSIRRDPRAVRLEWTEGPSAGR